MFFNWNQSCVDNSEICRKIQEGAYTQILETLSGFRGDVPVKNLIIDNCCHESLLCVESIIPYFNDGTVKMFVSADEYKGYLVNNNSSSEFIKLDMGSMADAPLSDGCLKEAVAVWGENDVLIPLCAAAMSSSLVLTLDYHVVGASLMLRVPCLFIPQKNVLSRYTMEQYLPRYLKKLKNTFKAILNNNNYYYEGVC